MRSLSAAFALCVFAAASAGCGPGPEDGSDAEITLSPEEQIPFDDVDVETDALTGCTLDTATESAQLTRINNRRAAIGVPKLAHRDCIRKVARAWSLKMCQSGTLSHNPNFSKQVAYYCGSNWLGQAENVGKGSTELSIWNAFMASSAHKANIQSRTYNQVGVGAYKAGNGTRFITHNFAKY